ncbi:hypothetical protein [Bacillus sp. Marseille-Q3570]|uniref:hypothetical protein n=1 Tax=Bacillus sp. Marseille-Q3570 TaxID=2963522 RepID=UPI0021B77257|nr:hypothetical protein [Bacillus sp. Marseille-Q3570]
MNILFGQEQWEKAGECPETTMIGTGTGGKHEQLSRTKAIRNRSRGKTREAVPNQSGTGQEQVKNTRSCPETKRYGTGAGEKREKLSRNKAIRDRNK